MDTGSIVVVLGVAALILGISLMRSGSRGAQRDQPVDDDVDFDRDDG